MAPYDTLTPDLILDAIDSRNHRCDGRLLALNSYENRVYQVWLEDGSSRVLKFYRPGRWSAEQIEEEHALELRTRDRERKLLKKVQQSIASIDAGEYGWCEVSGEPIGINRLIARPIATMTVESQQAHERREKISRDD